MVRKLAGRPDPVNLKTQGLTPIMRNGIGTLLAAAGNFIKSQTSGNTRRKFQPRRAHPQWLLSLLSQIPAPAQGLHGLLIDLSFTHAPASHGSCKPAPANTGTIHGLPSPQKSLCHRLHAPSHDKLRRDTRISVALPWSENWREGRMPSILKPKD